MEIKNETKLSFDELVNSLYNAKKITSNKNLKSSIILSCVLLAFSILCIIFLGENRFYIVCGIIILACSTISIIFFILAIIFSSKVNMIKQLKKSNKPFENGITYNYTFYDDFFFVKYSSDTRNGEETIKYNSITEVKIIDNDLFIFLNNFVCYVAKLDIMTEEEKKPLIDKLSIFIKK